jgi:hypothetical protein
MGSRHCRLQPHRWRQRISWGTSKDPILEIFQSGHFEYSKAASSHRSYPMAEMRRQRLTLPTHDEIREKIDRSGCDLFAFFQDNMDSEPTPDDTCFIHSISHRDTELLAVDIRRADAPAVSGLITKLMKNWESQRVKPAEACLAMGCNLMLQVVEPPAKFLDEIMDNAVRAAVEYRGNKDFSVLMLVPARRLTDREAKEIGTKR